MSSKGLSLGLINMYTHMVEEEFNPVISIAEARNARLIPAIRRKVYEEMGVYELEAKRAAIMTQVDEIDDQITTIKGKSTGRNYQTGRDNREGGLAQKEIERRLGDVDGRVSGLKNMKDSILKDVKLSGSTPEIQKTFQLLAEELGKVKEHLESLPPVDEILKQIGATNVQDED